jgi:hypothetical protein
VTSTGLFANAGQGFEKYITPDENLVEWRFVDVAGDYSADAPLDEPDGSADLAWVMQLVTFH